MEKYPPLTHPNFIFIHSNDFLVDSVLCTLYGRYSSFLRSVHLFVFTFLFSSLFSNFIFSPICRLCLAKLLIVYFHIIFACNWTVYILTTATRQRHSGWWQWRWRRRWGLRPVATISLTSVCLGQQCFAKFLFEFILWYRRHCRQSAPQENYRTKRF